jgi:hypothetical protein
MGSFMPCSINSGFVISTALLSGEMFSKKAHFRVALEKTQPTFS